MTKLDDLLAYEVVEGLTEGQFTAEEYVISILKRIEEVEPKVHSFITLDTEGDFIFCEDYRQENKRKRRYRSTCRGNCWYKR